MFLAERQALYERLYPETRKGVAGALARHRQSQSGRVRTVRPSPCPAGEWLQ